MSVYQQYQDQLGAPAPRPRNGLGIAALILGIIGILFGFVPLTFFVAAPLAIAAIVLGFAGRARAKRGDASNRKTATWGIVTGAAAAVLSIVGLIIVADAFSDIGQQSAQEAPQATTPSAPATGLPPDDSASSPPTPVEEDTQPAVLSLGDTATITTDGEDSGTITVSKLRITTRPSNEFGSEPAENYFLIFTVTLRATAPNFDTYEDDFYVLTPNGEHLDQGNGNSWDAVDLDKTIGYAELNTGEHKTGFLVFDSPSKHGTLNYAPNFEGGPIVSWTF